MNDNQTNFIIFSKDRACQLHACLESLKKHYKSNKEPTITVIYKASTPDFDKAYEKLKETFPSSDKFLWDRETNFKQQTINAVNRPSQFTIFLVDDDMFVNDVSTNDPQFSLIKDNSMMVALSQRLHGGANHCYPTDQPQAVPKFVKGSVWSWKQCAGDWGYPMSVDGNVYNTHFVKPLVESLNYSNPNTFEVALDSVKNHPSFPAYMCCYPEGPRLINIPANLVQNIYNNRHANSFSSEKLNELYLQGNVINVDAYQGIQPNTVHVPVELTFRKL